MTAGAAPSASKMSFDAVRALVAGGDPPGCGDEHRDRQGRLGAGDKPSRSDRDDDRPDAASRTIAMGVMDFRPEPLRSPGRPLDTGVLVVMAQRGEQLWEVVVVEGVVGVPALAADIDEVQLAQ